MPQNSLIPLPPHRPPQPFHNSSLTSPAPPPSAPSLSSRPLSPPPLSPARYALPSPFPSPYAKTLPAIRHLFAPPPATNPPPQPAHPPDDSPSIPHSPPPKSSSSP